MKAPLNPGYRIECIATYLNGELFVEVPMSEEERVEEITDYIGNNGIDASIMVYTLNSTPEGLVTNQKIEFVTASSLEELIARASKLIARQDHAKIDGRIPTARHNKGVDDGFSTLMRGYHRPRATKN